MRILTGGVVPMGADAVVRQEHVRENGGWVTFSAGVSAGSDIRRRAEEVRKGQVVLEERVALGPAQLGLCAAMGKAVVSTTVGAEGIALVISVQLEPDP